MTDSEQSSRDEQQDSDSDSSQPSQGAFELSMSPPLPTDTDSAVEQPESELDADADEDEDIDSCQHGQVGCPGPGPHDDEDEGVIECWPCYRTREHEPQQRSTAASGFVDKKEYAADEFVVPLTADVLETRLKKEGFVVVNRFHQSKREIEYMYLRADSEDEWERLQQVLRVAVGLLGFSPDIGADEEQYYAVIRIWRRPSDPEARIWSSGSRIDRAEREREGEQ